MPTKPEGNFNLSRLIRPETLKEVAYKEIKKILVTGQINGTKYYSANHFAELLGISRTPVREAVMQLAAEGFFVLHTGKGFCIKEYTKKEIQDFFETRKIFETHLIRKFYETMTKEDLDTLEKFILIMKDKSKKADASAFLEADKNFHLYFVQKSANQFLFSFMESLRELIGILGLKTIQLSERKESVVAEHQSILDALKDKDLKRALKATNEHLDNTEELLISYAHQ